MAVVGAIAFGALAVLGVLPMPLIGRPKIQMLLVGAAVLCGVVAYGERAGQRQMMALNETASAAEQAHLGVERVERIAQLSAAASAARQAEEDPEPQYPIRVVSAQMDGGGRLLTGVEEGQVVDLDAVRRAGRRSGAL